MTEHDPFALLDNDTVPGPGLTAAEIQIRREQLGVSIEWIARQLAINPRTWQRWEGGQSRPTGTRRLDEQISGLEAAADDRVDELVMWTRAHPGQPLRTWRWDDTTPDDLPAGWHRAVAARVVDRVQGLRVTYG